MTISIEYKIKELSNINQIDEYSSLYRIVITLSRKCNFKCKWCPHSTENIKENLKEGYMTIKTALKLKEKLSNKFSGIFSVSGFGEPTLNPDFLEIINIFHSIPNTKIDVISNGTNLEILERCNADNIHISAYTEESANELKERYKNNKKFTILDQFLNQNFNNRAGNVKSIKEIPDTCCNILFMKLSIDYNGDIIKCCSDWNKENILGNIHEDDLWNIWINERKEDRLKMLLKQRCDVNICNKCSAKGDIYGEKYKNFWEDYYAKH